MYLYSFLFCGLICLIGQIILDNTKLTPGHITSLFVIFGSFLDVFNIYDKIVQMVGGGALVPITSFGHLLIHGAMAKANSVGFVGIAMGCLILLHLVLLVLFSLLLCFLCFLNQKINKHLYITMDVFLLKITFVKMKKIF